MFLFIVFILLLDIDVMNGPGVRPHSVEFHDFVTNILHSFAVIGLS